MIATVTALSIVLTLGAPPAPKLTTATGKKVPVGTSILSYSIW